jgi:hypothetical protein
VQGISFPSYVSFDRAGKVLHVGRKAADDQDQGSSLVVWGVKTLVGLGCDEAQRGRSLLDYPTNDSSSGAAQKGAAAEDSASAGRDTEAKAA